MRVHVMPLEVPLVPLIKPFKPLVKLLTPPLVKPLVKPVRFRVCLVLVIFASLAAYARRGELPGAAIQLNLGWRGRLSGVAVRCGGACADGWPPFNASQDLVASAAPCGELPGWWHRGSADWTEALQYSHAGRCWMMPAERRAGGVGFCRGGEAVRAGAGGVAIIFASNTGESLTSRNASIENAI